MNKKALKFRIISIFCLFVLSLVGFSFSWFNYTRVGNENRVITGQLYLSMNSGTDTINLTNVFPETKEEARKRDDNTLTFTVTGKNTSTTKAIEYEIFLNNGDDKSGKSRFNDKDLVFDLVEIGENNEETLVLDSVSYDELNKTKIWIDTVDENTTEEIERTYKLRMWVSDDVVISDSDPLADYSATGENAFKNHYATIKVGVEGDLVDRELPLKVTTSETFIEDSHTYFVNQIENDEEQENVYKLNITSSNHDIQFKYDGSNDIVTNISNLDIDAKVSFLVNDDDKVIVKNIATEEITDSFEKEYHIAAGKKLEFNITLIPKNGQAGSTDLSFTLRKNGEVVQELVKHVKVGGLKYNIIYQDKVQIYDGNPVSIDSITIKNPDGSNYTGNYTSTYYTGDKCSGSPLNRAPVNVGSYSQKIVVPSSNMAEETVACGKINITRTTTVINITSTGGTYNGSPIPVVVNSELDVVVKYYTNNTCTNLIDQTNETKVPVNAGVYYAKAVLDDLNNYDYAESACTKHEILPKGISNITTLLSYDEVTYDGNDKEPVVTLKDGSTNLVEGTDYTIAYSNNTNAGEATVTITMKGNYTGTITEHFTINKASINVPSSPSDKTYNGNSQNHGVTVPSHVSVVTSGSDLTATAAGTYKVILKLDDSSNYKWNDNSVTNKEISWKILPKDTTNLTSTLAFNEVTYDGNNKEPGVTVKDGNINLVEGTDYTVAYSNNTNAGEATVTITMKGNYTGTITKTFTINKASITIPSSPSDKTYTGSSQNHGVTIPSHVSVVTSGSDLSATNVGNYKVILKLDDTNNYKWSDNSEANKEIGWKIVPKNTTNLTSTLEFNEVTYDGNDKEPSVTVKDGSKTLTSGTDYTVAYSNNKNAGEATVTITMKGNYTGTITKTFTINKASITVPSSPSDKTYIGTSQNHGITIPNHVSIVSEGSVVSTANAGTHKIILKLDDTNNYKWNDNTITNKEISWKILKSDTTTTLANINRDYNGDYQEASGATSKLNSNNSNISGATYTYTYYSNNTCTTLTTTPKNAGTYYVKATLDSTNNYNSSTSGCQKYVITAQTAVLTVESNSSSLTYKESTSISYTYDGDGTLSCTSSDSTKVSCSVDTVNHKVNITALGATTSPVTITLNASAGTYFTATSKTISVDVSKKAVTIKAKDQTIDYGESIVNNVNQTTVTGLASGDVLANITLTPSTSNVTTTGTITPSAARINDGSSNNVTGNYTITYQTGALTIDKIDATCPATITAFTGTYDKSSHTITVSSDVVGGTIEYRTATTGDGSTWTTTKPTRTSAGETTVYVRVNGDSNHNTVNCASEKITINKKSLTPTVTANNKNYDGTTTATCSSSVTLSGIVEGDTVTATANTTGAFASASVGNNKSVTCSGITLSGTSAGNYSAVTSATTTTANINKKPVTPTISSCENKTYDGNTSATCTYGTVSEKVGSEVVSLTGGTCTFDNKNAGTGKTVTCTEISLTGTNSGNYTLSTTSATKTATINKKEVTVTAEDKEMTYSGSAPTYTYEVEGTIGTETAVTGTATYTIKSGSTTINNVSSANVGTYDIIPSGLTSGSNYTINYENGTLTINKAQNPISVSATQNWGADYSESVQNHAFTGASNNQGNVTYSIQSQKAGDETVNYFTIPTAGTASIRMSGGTPAGTYKVVVRATAAGNSNYEGGYKDITITITVGSSDAICPSTITAYTGTYDGLSHTITVSNDSNGGTVEYRTATTGDGSTWTTTKPTRTNVGETTVYVRVNGDSNHNTITCGSEKITINKKALTVTANDKSMNYGATAPTYTSTITGFVNNETASVLGGSLTYTTKSGNTTVTINSSTNTGTYTIVPSGYTSSNYNITYVNGTLTIDKIDATCPSTLTGYTGTYDGSSHTITASGHVGGTLEYRTATSGDGSTWSTTKPTRTNQGTTTVYVRVNGDGNHNTVTCGSKTIVINKKEVTVTAENKSMNYAATAPAYSYVVTGAVGTETAVTGTATYTIKSGSNTINNVSTAAVGTYDIIPSGLTAGNNYTITYENGTLTINSIDATCPSTLTGYTGTYDGNSHTITASGQIGGTLEYRTATSGDGSSWTTTKPTRTNQGTTTVYVRVAGDSNHNTVTCGSKTIVINKKEVTVTADNKSMDYSGTLPEYTYEVEGAVGSETAVTGTATYTIKSGNTTIDNVTTANVGTYDIIPSGLTAGNNYTITYQKGTLTIYSIDATCPTTTAYTGTYDGSSHTITVTGGVGGTIEYRTSTTGDGSSWTTTKPTRTNAGTTTVYVRVNGDNNHNTVTCGSKTIIINKKSLTVTANDKSMNYGGTAPTYTSTITGFVNSETASVLGGTLTYTTKSGNTTVTVNGTTSVGTYDIVPSGYTSSNYDIAYQSGTLTINSIDATCPSTLTAYTGTYDGNSHTISASGQVGGTLEYRTATTGDGSTWSTTKPTRTNQGTTTVYVRVKGDSNHNTVECSSKTIVINKKALTPTVSASDKNYDGTTTATCSSTVSLSGIVTGDTVTATASTNGAFASASVGNDKSVTCSGITLGGIDKDNYSVVSSATTTADINKKPVTPTISSCENKTYNGNTSATCTYGTVSEKVGSEVVSLTGGTCTFDNKNVGTGKMVTCTGISLTGTNSSNYVLSTTSATKTANISKKTLTVTADDKSMSYGGTAPTFTSTVTGFVTGESVSNLGGTLTHTIKSGNTTITLSSSTAVGIYTIVPSGYTSSNYDFNYVNGELTIGGVDATCPSTLNGYTGTYDGNSHTITASGQVGGTIEYRTATSGDGSTWTTTKPTRTNQGTTTVYVRVNGDDNHNTVNCDSKTIVINKKEVTVTAANKSMSYGGTAPSYSYTVAGAVGSETAVSGTATYTIKNGDTTLNNVSTANVGSYTIIPSGLTAGDNYTIVYANGTLTINRAKTATKGSCANPTYTGSSLDLVTHGTGVTYSGNTQTNVKTGVDYTITVTPDSNHAWSNGTTTSDTLSCNITPQQCNAPSNLSVSTSGIVTWTASSNCPTGQHQIRIGNTGEFANASSGVDKLSEITASSGTVMVYVKTLAPNANYSNSSSSGNSKTVYSLTLTAGTGIDSVTGAGNYIDGASASINATVKEGYTWSNWTGSSTISDQSTSITVNSNKSYTANATGNKYTATFYYQSNSTNGSTTVSSTTAECTITGNNTSCNAEIPSAVKSSDGTYNNAYYGLSESTGNMTVAVNSSATTVSLNGNKDYYALYSSAVTVNYPTSTSEKSSATAYRNQWLSSKTAIATTVLATTATGTTDNYSFSSSVTNYNLYGFATTNGTNTRSYNNVSALKTANATTVYAILSRDVTPTFYYSNDADGTVASVTGTAKVQYLRCTSDGAELSDTTLSIPTLTGEVAPTGTSGSGWSKTPNVASLTSVKDTSSDVWYRVYKDTVTIYKPRSTTACDNTDTMFYRNAFINTATPTVGTTKFTKVLSTTSTGTTTNASYTSGVSGYSILGYATSRNIDTVTYNDLTALRNGSATTVYAVLSKEEAENATFYYSNSATGSKTSTTVSGTMTTILKCTTSDSVAGTSVIHGTISAPTTLTGEVAPYGTESVGWASSNNSMSTVSSFSTGNSYYKVYKTTGVKLNVHNSTTSTTGITLNRNAFYGSNTNYTVVINSGNQTSNYNEATAPTGYTFYGYATERGTNTKSFDTIPEAAYSNATELYTMSTRVVTPTFYYSTDENGTVGSVVGTPETQILRFKSGAGSELYNPTVTIPTINDEIEPSGTLSVGWANSSSKMSTSTPSTGYDKWYKVYRNTVTMYKPKSTSLCNYTNTQFRRNAFIDIETPTVGTTKYTKVLASSDGGITNNASYTPEVDGYSLLGFATARNTNTLTYTNFEEVRDSIVTTIYAVLSKEEAENATFYYSNSSTGGKTSTTVSGAKTTYLKCTTSNTTAGTQIVHETLNEPTMLIGEISPYETTANGWSNSPTSNGSSTTFETGNSYYRKYKTNINFAYSSAPGSSTATVYYRNALYGENTNYTVVISNINNGTTNVSDTVLTNGYTLYGYTSQIGTHTKEFNTIAEAAPTTVTELYTIGVKQVTPTFYYSKSTDGTVGSVTGTTKPQYLRYRSTSSTEAVNEDFDIPTLTGEVIPTGTESVGWSTSATSMGTVTPSTAYDKYYKVYRNTVTVYKPSNTSTCNTNSTVFYRNTFINTSTPTVGTTKYTKVLSKINTGTSDSANYESSISGFSLEGYSNSINDSTITYADITALKNSSATTSYAVLGKPIDVTFYYSNSSTGAKTNSTVTGTKHLVCNTTSTAGYIDGEVTPPMSSTAPYGTTRVGWATGAINMNSATVNTANTSYYEIYRGNVTNYYYNNSSYAARTLYRTGVYGSDTNYSMHISTGSAGTSNYSIANGPGGAIWNGLSTAADTTAEYTTIDAAANSTSTNLYTVYQFNVEYAGGANVTAIGTTAGNCKVSATGASTGGTSCNVTLPTITAEEGYLPVGWSLTNGDTTGTPAGSTYSLNTNGQTLYANAKYATITGSVSITGTPTWGETLTANPSCSTPSTCTFTNYQWYSNGVAISGATSSTYVIPKSEVGNVITVSVKASATNYIDKTLTSSGTEAIGKRTVTVTAVNKSMTYSGSAPTYSYNVTGAVGSDTPVTGTATYTIKSGNTTINNVSTADAGTYSIIVSGLTIDSNYQVNYVNGTLTINKDVCTLTTTAKSMNTGETLTLSTAANNPSGTLTYALKSGGNNTTTASTITNGILTAGAMSTANDNDQTVDVVITDSGDNNHESCSKDLVVTVSKNDNTMTSKNSTVYVSSTSNLSEFVQNNIGGTLSATIGTDNEGGTVASTNGTNFTAGTLLASDDSDKTVTLNIKAARTATVKEKTVTSTITVQKYTRGLTLTVDPLMVVLTQTATLSVVNNGTGGTPGTVTYSSSDTNVFTINGTTLTAIADSGTSNITATRAGSTTVKSATSNSVTVTALDVWAENLSYDNSNTNLNCSDIQCALDSLKDMLDNN